MERLRSKVAIATGAAGGIGRATARRLAAEGAVVAAWDLDPDGIASTVKIIAAEGGKAMAVAVDVTVAAQVQEALGRVLHTYGRLDIVFNGVGVSGRKWGDGPADQCTEEGWERVLATNLRSVFLVCKHALPALIEAHGAIVNLSSVLGLVGGDDDFATHAYAASKGGIIALSRAMAVYYAPRGVRVNVIAPGLIATPMSQRAQSDPRIQARLPQLQPLTGAMGTADDVAAAVAYLASDDAGFVTGATLTVDGGWTAQ
jgi:NAD(P)-dependent dehydrogenase (short-subunit alcohol dehydrogenase family)